MFGIMLFLIFAAGVAFVIRTWLVGRREAREYGQHMHVRYVGHTPHYQRRTSSGADFGVPPDRDAGRNWQPDDAAPTALDSLYEQMSAQEEGYRQRERERERERGY